MTDMFGLMKQAQAMQSRMQDIQAELERLVVEGQAGGGAVRIGMSAKGQIRSVNIEASLLKPEDKEILEDLIIAAHDDARRKGEAATEEKMKGMTSGMKLPPGMKLPF